MHNPDTLALSPNSKHLVYLVEKKGQITIVENSENHKQYKAVVKPADSPDLSLLINPAMMVCDEWCDGLDMEKGPAFS